MKLSYSMIRTAFSDFWKSKKHIEVPPIPLVPKDDPTTLFTGSGMQQLVPYLLGEVHPLGKRLFNIQPCLRVQDIEEVGDNRHDTFFEMMGNWSLGDYGKKDQLTWVFEFLVKELGLNPKYISVTVFEGDKENKLPRDEESKTIWNNIFTSQKMNQTVEKKVWSYPSNKNWWSRAGIPEKMPVGEPGGPDSEIFFEFDSIKHNKEFGPTCHPNCDCGRFLEIGNSVFMQYKKMSAKEFSTLPNINVDFGGGLERLIMAVENQPDLFLTQLFLPLIRCIESETHLKYSEHKKEMRIVADHIKTAFFLVSQGVEPGNKEQGYVLRRLIRRAVVYLLELQASIPRIIPLLCSEIHEMYKEVYFQKINPLGFSEIIGKEADSFLKTVHKGTLLLQKQKKENITGSFLFNLKQSYGFPIEIALEQLEKEQKLMDKEKIVKEYEVENKKHQDLSRTSSAGKFKGGLADQSSQTLKYHTATHILHQALFEVLGSDVKQQGSNITGERLRFDFSASHKPTEDEVKKIEKIVNAIIEEKIPVSFQLLPKIEAEKIGAKSFFREKYPEMVKVYSIGSFSKEFCGGPHVTNTNDIGKITIYKVEKIGSLLFRIYAH